MIQFQVGDMTCGHCAATITKAVKAAGKAGLAPGGRFHRSAQ